MAPDLRAVSITIYNKSWSIVLSIPSWDFYDDNTVWEVLEDSRVVALWITEISTAQWWTAAPHSNTLHNYTQSGTELNIVFYDVTPTPSTLTSHGHIWTWHIQTVQPFECYDEYIKWDWSWCYVALKEVTSTHWTALYNKINEAKIAKHWSTSSRITIEEFYDYISWWECNLDAIYEDYREDYLSACFCRDWASDWLFDVSRIPSDYGSAIDEWVAIVWRILDNWWIEVKYVYDREQFWIKLSDYTAGESMVYLSVPQKVNDYLKANDKSFVLPYYIDL